MSKKHVEVRCPSKHGERSTSLCRLKESRCRTLTQEVMYLELRLANRSLSFERTKQLFQEHSREVMVRVPYLEMERVSCTLPGAQVRGRRYFDR